MMSINNIDEVLKVKPLLSATQVHVFLFQLSLFDPNELLSYLSEDEQSRAAKLKIEKKRGQFIVTRGLLRVLLSSSLDKRPAEIAFSYGQNRKPYINEKINNKPLEFNVSHSGDYALIAMTLENQVGIDIEEINPKIDYVSLSKRFFSEQEKNSLTTINKDEQLDAFYQVWTRKESFIKAIGEGVAFGLDNFSVSTEKNTGIVMEITTIESMSDKWFCYDLLDVGNYKTALTTCKKDIDILMST